MPAPTTVADVVVLAGDLHRSRFAGTLLNACVVSKLEPQIQHRQPAPWLHGHVHHSCDYRLGAIRLLADPRGCAPGGEVENPGFDAELKIELA